MSSDLAVERFVGPNQILPSQYFDLSGGNRLTGEQRLMLALLADAINVYRQGATSHSTRKRMLYADAERWIMAGAQDQDAFSFDSVCEALEVNSGVLRRRMISWKHQVRRGAEARPSAHLRLKITPRSKHLHQRRRRAPAGIPVLSVSRPS